MAEESNTRLLVRQRFYFRQQFGVHEIVELEGVNEILFHFHKVKLRTALETNDSCEILIPVTFIIRQHRRRRLIVYAR